MIPILTESPHKSPHSPRSAFRRTCREGRAQARTSFQECQRSHGNGPQRRPASPPEGCKGPLARSIVRGARNNRARAPASACALSVACVPHPKIENRECLLVRVENNFCADRVNRKFDLRNSREALARNTEAERQACEIRLRAERKAGKLLAETKKSQERAGTGRQHLMSPRTTLNRLGISRDQSSRCASLGKSGFAR